MIFKKMQEYFSFGKFILSSAVLLHQNWMKKQLSNATRYTMFYRITQ